MKSYQLLPFRFERFKNNKVFISNECGEFIFLTPEHFSDMVSYKLDKKSSVFLDLKSKQILTDTSLAPVINMLATKYRTKKNFLNDFTSLHMIVPTLRCNSNCSYCQVSSKTEDESEYNMDEKTARNTVEMIFNSPSPHIKIEFQGGEPLLKFEIVKQIIEEAEKQNNTHKRNLEFVVCTNLSLITDKILKYLKNHNVFISTSLDGPKILHNTNRPLRKEENSYDLLANNISKVRKYLGKDRIDALMTTTKNSLEVFSEIIDEYVRLGFHYIFIRTLNPYGLAKKEKDKLGYKVEDFFEVYKDALEYIINLNLKGHFLLEGYACLLLTRILTPFSTGFVDMQSPAGIGISGVIYNYDGNVYASDEGRMLASMGDHKFLMGNVNKNSYKEIFYGERIKSWINKACLECLPICSTCAFQSYCGADPVRNYSEQGDIIGNVTQSEVCKKNKLIITHLLELIDSGDKDIQDVFWSWLTRRTIKELRNLN